MHRNSTDQDDYDYAMEQKEDQRRDDAITEPLNRQAEIRTRAKLTPMACETCKTVKQGAYWPSGDCYPCNGRAVGGSFGVGVPVEPCRFCFGLGGIPYCADCCDIDAGAVGPQ